MSLNVELLESSFAQIKELCLEEAWTPNVEQAWIEAYRAIAQVMLNGAEYPAEILNPAV
jgi:hemoglobin-like flavoprotein